MTYPEKAQKWHFSFHRDDTEGLGRSPPMLKKISICS